MKLSKGAWIIVADGAKHLILENGGDPMHPDLRVLDVERLQPDAAAQHEPSDRPGRRSGPDQRRSAIEPDDWQRDSEDAFTAKIGDRIATARSQNVPEIVLIADPRTLGVLRMQISAADRPLIRAEIGANLAHVTLERIEEAIAAA